jgi:TetR/AcrR family transcriptional repressor of nem operon
MSRPQGFDDGVVLGKAVDLFWEQGYSGTSAQNMVDALGINRSSIYNTYSDKKGLFTRALQHYRACETRGLLQILENAPPDIHTLRSLLEHVAFSSLEKTSCRGCFVVNSAIEFGQHDEQVLAIISDNIREVVSAFAQFIEKGQQSGQISAARPAQDLAVFLFHSMTAMRVTTKVIEDRAFFQSNIDTILQIFTL